jgi:CRP/FNR family transcriptional regulator
VEFFAAIGAGFVKMTRSTSQGVDVTTEIFGPFQVLGMLGTIKGSGCPQSAYAVCETHFIKIPKDRFLPYYRENMVMKDQLLARTSDRLTRAHAMLTRMSTSRAEVRIAQILVILAEGYGEEEGSGVYLRVPLTRQSIAEMAGTTVETTIRIMSDWQKRGLVSTESKVVHIRDLNAFSDLLD